MSEHENLPEKAGADRRMFMTNAGRFVMVVPPAMTLLLSTSLQSGAIAQSADEKGKGSSGNNGKGNGCDSQPKGTPKENDTSGCV